MALYRYATKDDLANLKFAPTQEQTMVYNALNSNSSSAKAPNDNFFTKKAKSIENALGTTGATVVGAANEIIANNNRDNMRKDQRTRMNDIAKKYGYNTYQDVWDARDVAEANGDTETLNKIDNIINPELKAQANANANEMDKFASNYKDYVKNDYIGQKTNQDRGKFLGSAINTMSTATDVLGLTNGPLANAIQGGIEGVADELEQNGLENFDWARAGQNALTGAASGAVTGALNAKINGALAKRGGNLLKGGNKLTQAINSFNATNPVGKLASSLGTGAARGAISGAVGGATGAGLSAAMNNQDVLGSALQGAKQGAISGAGTGAIMTGANMAIDKTPGVGKFLRDVNQAQQDWKNSGSNFDERLTNTLTSGDSPIGEWVQGNKQSGALSRLRNMGGTLQDTSALIDNTGRAIPTEIAERLANIDPRLLDKNGNIKVMYHGTPNGGFERFDDGSYFTEDKTYADGYQNPSASSLMPKTEAKNPMTYDTYIDAKKLFDINDSDARKIYIDDYVKGGNANSIDPYRSNYDDIRNIDWTEVENLREFLKDNPQYGYDGIIANEGGVPNDNGGVTYRGDSVIPMSGDQVIIRNGVTNQQTPTTLGGWLKKAGQRIVEDANNKGVGLSVKDVSSDMPEDIRNMQINDNTGTPETEVYRTLTGEKTNPSSQDEEPFLAYGESGLATGKTKKQNILSKAGRAMEAAQVNATRKETRDIGIENSGELVNRVRQKTGLTDLETQAQFAKELTGGADSLLDNIQRNAIAATEDGKTRTADLDAILPQVNKLIDDAPNTLISPSQKEKIRNAVKADLTNGGIDTITKANNFKSAAAQQYLINERTPNDSAKELGKLYTKVADLVDEASYNAIPQSQVDAMFETAISEARGRAKIASDNGKNDIAQAYNKLGDTLENTPRDVANYRNVKKDFVDVNKLNKKTMQGATAWNNSPLTMGTAITAAMATGNPLVGVPAAWAAKTFAPALGQYAIDASAKLGGKLADWGDKLSANKASGGSPTGAPDNTSTDSTNSVVMPNNNPSMNIYNAIGRSEGRNNAQQARTADYLVNAAQEAQVVNDNTSVGTTMNPQSTSLYNTLYGQIGNTAQAQTSVSDTGYFQPTGDYWTDIIAGAMSDAIDANDMTSFATLYQMYQDQLSNISKNTEKDYSNPVNWSSSDRSKLLDAQNGLDQIDSLENVYYNAVGEGGGNFVQGGLRGIATNIFGGNLDPSATNYVQKANSLGAGIIKNLINLGSTEHDAARYIEYLPKLTDTKEQAAQKLQDLRNAYEKVINNLYSVYNA